MLFAQGCPVSSVYSELPDHNLCNVQIETALKPAAAYARITTLVFKESKSSCKHSVACLRQEHDLSAYWRMNQSPPNVSNYFGTASCLCPQKNTILGQCHILVL